MTTNFHRTRRIDLLHTVPSPKSKLKIRCRASLARLVGKRELKSRLHTSEWSTETEAEMNAEQGIPPKLYSANKLLPPPTSERVDDPKWRHMQYRNVGCGTCFWALRATGIMIHFPARVHSRLSRELRPTLEMNNDNVVAIGGAWWRNCCPDKAAKASSRNKGLCLPVY